MTIVDPCWRFNPSNWLRPDSPSPDPAFGTETATEPAPVKVILELPAPSANALIFANLMAVALGTLKLFLWATVIVLSVFGAFFAGMVHAAARQRRRSW